MTSPRSENFSCAAHPSEPEVETHLAHLERDFIITRVPRSSGALGYQLGEFRAFVGQEGQRHELFAVNQATVS